MAIDFSFIDAAAPQPQQAPQDDVANVTIRVDADAMLLCDGEYLDIELKAGVVKKAQLPAGQHLLEFLSEKNPDVKIEKVVDFPVAGKNYLVMVSGLQEVLAQFESKAAVALGAKKIFKLVITSYENEMGAIEVLCNIMGCSVAEARAKLAGLPAVVIESEDKARVEALAGQFAKGNVEVVVETRNGHGELLDSVYYEAEGTTYLNTAEDYREKQNHEEAAKWYRKAADKGNADAMCELGDCYYASIGVEYDAEEGLKWYRKAAEKDNADAMYRLGDCYRYCWGVEKDEEESVKWYRKAAEKGNADAMYKLGKCYYKGEGVEEDKEEGEKWMQRARELGSIFTI